MGYQVIVHAGGKGTRMLPLTLDKPKVLIDLNGKPLLEHVIQPFTDAGIKDFVITTSYKADMIKNWFQSKGLNVRFIDEPKPSGRGGAVQLGINQKVLDPDKPALMINGDDILKYDLKEFIKSHEESKCSITIGLSRDFQNPYGVVNVTEGKAVSFVEKPMQTLADGKGINAGIIGLTNLRMFLDIEMPYNPEDKVYPKFAEKNDVNVFFVDEWHSVNTKQELERVSKLI